MRLFEIETKVRIFATKRYLKNAAYYARGYPSFRASLEDFLKFKLSSPLVSWGGKDEPFTGGLLTGIWHAHLIHGKVMVIYRPRADQIALYDVGEHNSFEGKAVMDLAKYVNNALLQPMQEPTNKKLTPAQAAEFEQLIVFMVEQDRDILEAAARGDFAGLKEFVSLVPLDWASVVETNGGNTALRKKLKHMLT